MSAKKEICFLCGEDGADSDDHNPPKSLFDNKNPNTLVLPAHVKCQNRFSKDEEYFVNVVRIASFMDDAAWKIYWKKDSLDWQKQHRKGLRRKLLKSMVEVPIQTKSNIFLGTAPGLKFDSHRMSNVAMKILYAIFYHHYGSVFPPHRKVEFYYHQSIDQENQGLCDVLQKKGLVIDQFYKIGNYQEFQYYITDSNELGKLSDWILIFYNRLIINCLIHGPEEEGTINSQLE